MIDLEIDPYAVERLLCVAGIDFIHGISIASPQKLVKAYLKSRKQRGVLGTPESIKLLVYCGFVSSASGSLPETLLGVLSEFGSKKWILAVRQLVFTRALSADQILPVEEDLDLFCKRVLCFNVAGYLERARNLVVWPVQCDEDAGYVSVSGPLPGAPLLYKKKLGWRRALVKRMNPKCSCGASSTKEGSDSRPKTCGPNSRCSCAKANLSCSSACKCSKDCCLNSVSSSYTVPGSGQRVASLLNSENLLPVSLTDGAGEADSGGSSAGEEEEESLVNSSDEDE